MVRPRLFSHPGKQRLSFPALSRIKLTIGVRKKNRKSFYSITCTQMITRLWKCTHMKVGALFKNEKKSAFLTFPYNSIIFTLFLVLLEQIKMAIGLGSKFNICIIIAVLVSIALLAEAMVMIWLYSMLLHSIFMIWSLKLLNCWMSVCKNSVTINLV